MMILLVVTVVLALHLAHAPGSPMAKITPRYDKLGPMLIAMASNLIAMASNLIPGVSGYAPRSFSTNTQAL